MFELEDTLNAFVILFSVANYYHNEEEEEVANLPAWERNLRGRTPLPLPQVVTTQPYPGIGYDDLRREHERRRRLRQEHQRRARSRISLNAANFIYPMRAPSNLAYHSPPPPYEESTTEIPSYQSLDAIAAGREESRRSGQTGREDRVRVSQMQINEQFRPMVRCIHYYYSTTVLWSEPADT